MNGLAQWHDLKHFHPDSKVDQWGDPHKIDRELLLRLDAMRARIGLPTIVLSGYRDPGAGQDGRGDNGKSQHGHGLAADIVVPSYGGHLLDLYIEATRFNFNGIGIYRDWVYDGRKVGGLHLDVRNVEMGARWFCYKDKRGVQLYIPLTHENLKLYGVI